MRVPYYQGRPAWLITAAMQGRGETAAKPAVAAAADGMRPVAHAATGEEASVLAVAAAISTAWQAWAVNWFTPPRSTPAVIIGGPGGGGRGSGGPSSGSAGARSLPMTTGEAT